ncbi:MAG: hypothetical protein IJK29_01995 [Bacteroidales bacterium]|nr:hypothetical protein [Bacteroidales bacterium]
MRKITVIGTSLLLLAIASCSREKETSLADGIVKMRFTAVVADGSTRTAYENDKTVSWLVGDALSVYVTNGTDGQVVTFTAGEDLAFEGNVPAGYTTIVAGAYPADAAHTFDATGVKTLHFPASYTLAEGADPASILPLAGTYADGVMTFRHPAGALKFTIDNVPATAVRFRFTAAGQKVNGSFAMDPALATTEVEAEQSVDITVPASEGSRSFYVPMPAGELAAGSIALYDAENNLLFQKSVPQAMTVSKNVIKRIAAVETWKKNEAWQVKYVYDLYNKTAQKVYSYVNLSGTTGLYDISLSTKSYFDSHFGSIEGFLSSDFISGRQASGTTPKSGDKNYYYNRLTPGGTYVMVVYGVDENYNFTGEYNIVEFEVPEFTQPENWHLTFRPSYNVNGELHPAVHIQVPEGTSYSTANLKKETFLNNYGGDAAAYIWTRVNPTTSVTIRTSKDINLYFGSLDETDYVYIVYGVREAEQTGGNRILTYEYALLEYTYVKPSDEPTEAYSAWIGKWTVTESSGDAPFTDTWTISAKSNNASYKITGLVKRTSWEVLGLFEENGTLLIKAQKDIAKTTSGDYEVSVNLYGKKADGKTTPGTYDLMRATMDPANPGHAVLAPPSSSSLYVSYLFYGTYTNSEGTNMAVTWKNGTRSNSAAMTRAAEEEVMHPDDWDVAEDFTQGSEPVVIIDALPGE